MNKKLDIKLRQTEIEDFHTFFQFQLDEEANYLAAFIPEDRKDKSAYLTKHIKLLSDPTINYMTITFNNIIVGSIMKFEREGEAEITYWIDKEFLGARNSNKSSRRIS